MTTEATQEFSVIEKALLDGMVIPTTKGSLSISQLFGLPLTNTTPDSVSLNSIAQAINVKLQASKDFVSRADVNPATATLTKQLAVVVRVIEIKSIVKQSKEDEAARASEAATLRRVLEQRQAEKLESLTEDQIKERLKALEEGK